MQWWHTHEHPSRNGRIIMKWEWIVNCYAVGNNVCFMKRKAPRVVSWMMSPPSHEFCIFIHGLVNLPLFALSRTWKRICTWRSSRNERQRNWEEKNLSISSWQEIILFALKPILHYQHEEGQKIRKDLESMLSFFKKHLSRICIVFCRLHLDTSSPTM